MAFILIPSITKAFNGNTSLLLSPSSINMQSGETKTVEIKLDTQNLSLDTGENVNLVGIYLSYPNNLLEVVGDINFEGSAFSTPYKSEYDNTTGKIDIIRTRDDNNSLSGSALIAKVTFKAKENISDSVAKVIFVKGQNTVLLDDIDSSDTLESWNELEIKIGKGGETQIGDNSVKENTQGKSYEPIQDATIRIVPSKTGVNVDEIIPVQIRINTGSAKNNVSSIETEINLSNNLRINENSVDISKGVFHNAIINTVNNAQGKITLQLTANPTVHSSNALIGTFNVKKTSSGMGTISIANQSKIIADDVNNTNIFLSSGSSGVNFTDSGPTVTASIEKSNFAEDEDIKITFKSSQTGDVKIKKDDCTATETIKNSNVSEKNKNQNLIINANDFNKTGNQKIVVCVTNSQNQTGQSNNLMFNIKAKEIDNSTVPKLQMCSVSPNFFLIEQSSFISFISDVKGEMSIRKNNCQGQQVPFFYQGSRVFDFKIEKTSSSCNANINRFEIKGENLKEIKKHDLVVCVKNNNKIGNLNFTLTVNKPSPLQANIVNTGSSSSGNGGYRNYTGDSNTSNNTQLPYCQNINDLKVKSLPNGKFLFNWTKVSDTKVKNLILNWGSNPNNLDKNIIIPNLNTLVYPGINMTTGYSYYFNISAIGDCKESFSNNVSAIKKETSTNNNVNQTPPPEEKPKEHKAPPTNSQSGMSHFFVFLTSGIGILIYRFFKKVI